MLVDPNGNMTPYIPFEVLFHSIANGIELSIKDFSSLRMATKECNVLNDFYTETLLDSVFRSSYPQLHDSVPNFSSTLKNSYVNFVHLEQILVNMKVVQYRKLRDKYAHLLKQKIVHSIDDGLNPTKTHNTLEIFRGLQSYVAQHMCNQPYAPTDLNRRTVLWTTDFIVSVLQKTSSLWLSPNTHYYITSYFEHYSSLTNTKGELLSTLKKCRVPYVDFFTLLAAGILPNNNTDMFDLLVENSFWYRTSSNNNEQITATLSLLLNLQSFFQMHNPVIKNRIVHLLMEYIFCVLENEKDTVVHGDMFKQVCLARCEDFIEVVANSNDEYLKAKIKDVCTRLIYLCTRF